MPFHYLYVEDDALSREVMQTLLEEIIGAQVTIFEDSQDFMARLKALQPQPDFVFLDLNIPPQNGYELLEMIRQDPMTKGYKVLVVTASLVANLMSDLKARGFDGALSKPVDMRSFPDLIEQLESGLEIWHTS